MTASDRPARIKFGTDGWRALIADEFTFHNLERVAQAYADFLLSELAMHTTYDASQHVAAHLAETLRVVVGYDRRFLSEQFARRAAEVLSGNGLAVSLFARDVPTPLVSWAVREGGAAGGVVITASHNPAHFNGFKIKAPWGGSATEQTTLAVEALVDAHAPRRATELPASVHEGLGEATESYRRQIGRASCRERV